MHVYSIDGKKIIEKNTLPNEYYYSHRYQLTFQCACCGAQGFLRKRKKTIEFVSLHHKRGCNAGKRADFIEHKIGKAYFPYDSILSFEESEETPGKLPTPIIDVIDKVEEESEPEKEVEVTNKPRRISSVKLFIENILSNYKEDDYITLGTDPNTIIIEKKALIIQNIYYEFYLNSNLNGLHFIFDFRPVMIPKQLKRRYQNTLFFQDSRPKKHFNDGNLVFRLMFKSNRTYVQFKEQYFKNDEARKKNQPFKRPVVFGYLQYDPILSALFKKVVYAIFVNKRQITWLNSDTKSI